MAVRVFSVNEYEWWVHDGDAADLLEKYMAETGVTREDALGDDDPGALPVALSDGELDRLMFNADGESLTFREQLAREVRFGGPFPRIFASTEY